MKCQAITKKLQPCKNKAQTHDQYCWMHTKSAHHPPPPVPSIEPKPSVPKSDVTLDLLNFIEDALKDMATLSDMKKQYCTDRLPHHVREEMVKLEQTMDRILQGSRSPNIPGLQSLIDDFSTNRGKVPADSILALRRKFLTTLRSMSRLIVENCRVSSKSFRIPDLRIDITTKEEGCKEIPAQLQEWYDRDDEEWKDKHIMCIAKYKGELVDLPVGLILHDKFEVVLNIDKKYYGIARHRGKGDCDTFACRLSRMISNAASTLQGYFLSLVNALVGTISLIVNGVIRLTPTLLRVLLRYWKYVLTTIVMVIVTRQYSLMPPDILKVGMDMIKASVDILNGSIRLPTRTAEVLRRIAQWVLVQIGQAFKDLRQPLRMIAAPPTYPMIGPPPLPMSGLMPPMIGPPPPPMSGLMPPMIGAPRPRLMIAPPPMALMNGKVLPSQSYVLSTPMKLPDVLWLVAGSVAMAGGAVIANTVDVSMVMEAIDVHAVANALGVDQGLVDIAQRIIEVGYDLGVFSK